MMKDEPTLEDALDGLINAVNYCDDRGMNDLAIEIAGLYQQVAKDSPEDEWIKSEGLIDGEN